MTNYRVDVISMQAVAFMSCKQRPRPLLACCHFRSHYDGATPGYLARFPDA